jgi:hypothetical protein
MLSKYQRANTRSRGTFDHTSASLNSLCVVVRNVVVDPSEVSIRVFGRVARLQILQPSSDHTVAEQTWEQRNLQRKPVLRLSDVENVAAVRCASCCQISMCSLHNRIPPLRTLTFLILLHVFLCETKFFALFDM